MAVGASDLRAGWQHPQRSEADWTRKPFQLEIIKLVRLGSSAGLVGHKGQCY